MPEIPLITNERETQDSLPFVNQQESLAHLLDDDSKKRTLDVLSVDDHLSKSKLTTFRFSDFQISAPILRGLAESGFSRPSPVQVKAIPLGLMGLDLIVQAKSGTGKTIVFAIVLLESIDVQRPVLQALILAPTREIALQSQNVFHRLSSHIPGLKCQLFVGGIPLADDLRHLQSCHIAVGTPGRLRYLIESGYMCVDHVRHLALDEADLLLAGGAESKLTGGSANNAFPADVNSIWWSLPQTKQVIALSATYTDYLVKEHLQRYMNNPAIVRLTSEDPALLGVRQFFSIINSPDRTPVSVFGAKVASLCKLLSSVEFQQCLIFSNFHSSAQDLCDALHSRGWPVSYISSNLNQEERFRAYNRLRAFHCRVLVTTDLTSRGIDAENVNLVVSLEVPWEHEIYVHRVGRAGRFGSYGASVLIVADIPEELRLLKNLQRKCPTQILQLPDPVPADLAAPECPIDLENVVTVISCLNETERKLEQTTKHALTARFADRTSRTARRRKPIPDDLIMTDNNSIEPRSAESVHNRTLKDEQSWSELPEKLDHYIKSVQLLTNDEFPSNEQDISDTELVLLNLMETYIKQGMPDTMKSNVVNTVGHHLLPKKEPPKYAREISHETDQKPFTSDSQTPADFQWTVRQSAAWYEYQKLICYAKWYYQAWQASVNEYNEASRKFSPTD